MVALLLPWSGLVVRLKRKGRFGSCIEANKDEKSIKFGRLENLVCHSMIWGTPEPFGIWLGSES